MTHRALPAVLLTAVLLAPVPGRGAELPLFDPFDTTVFGYVSTIGNVTVEWSALDVAGAPGSGSARLVNTRGDAGSGPVNRALDCFPVEVGTPYTAGASILIPAGQERTGVAQVFVSWFASGSCAPITLLDYGRTPEIRSAGSWQRSEQALLPPAGAASARIGLVLFKNESGASLAAHFDDLLLAPEPAGGPSGAVSAVALAALRRRARRRAASGS